MKFKEYKTDANDDGSVNIRDLEIFRLCERDGEVYDEDWFNNVMLKLFNQEKEQGYFPPAVIGHEEPEGVEPESIGLLDFSLAAIISSIPFSVRSPFLPSAANRYKSPMLPDARRCPSHPIPPGSGRAASVR